MFIAAIIISAVLTPSRAVAQTQAAPPQRDVLAELLVEVRGLRQAMERAATVGARIQLLVARVQLQEQRIAESARRLSTVHDEQSKLEEQITGVMANVTNFEKHNSSIPPEQREELQRMVEQWKSEIAILEKRRQDLTNEESQLLQQVNADQGRWSDVNAQLDDIERTLAAPPKKQ